MRRWMCALTVGALVVGAGVELLAQASAPSAEALLDNSRPVVLCRSSDRQRRFSRFTSLVRGVFRESPSCPPVAQAFAGSRSLATSMD